MLKILLPTDFSINSWNAISYASRFFMNEECIFYLLHTYTPAFYRMDYMIGGPSFSAIPDSGVDSSLAGLEKTLADVKEQHPNPKHTFETVSAFNTLTDEINDLAVDKEIDLVLMGTQGATGAKEIFLGTNTVYVLRKAIIPVMAVPDGAVFNKIKKVLFATDHWSKYKSDEVQHIIDIAKMQQAEITVLHIKEEYDLTESQQENKKHLLIQLDGVPHVVREKKDALMPNAILEYIEEHDYDLLAMMNRKHSFITRFLLRQNVDQIGFHVKIPFLVIPDTAKISK